MLSPSIPSLSTPRSAHRPSYSTFYLLSLHDALPISGRSHLEGGFPLRCFQRLSCPNLATGRCHWHDNPNTRGSFIPVLDRKSTRLNSSHVAISYAVFCLKKQKLQLTSSHHDHAARRSCDV